MARTLRDRRFFGSGQPQTLQIAVALLYWNAFLSLLAGLIAGGFGRLALLVLVADVAGAFGVANDRKWGYYLALSASVLPLVLVLTGLFIAGGLLGLIFQIALVALLLHPQSRFYAKLFFR